MQCSLTAAAVLAAKADDDIDAGDLVAFGGGRRLVDDVLGAGNVDERVMAFDKEMVMRRGVSVEVGLRAVDGDLAQQAGFGELMQRVVDGRERDGNFGLGGFLVKHFRGEMAVALAEQNPAERHTLPRRPQANLAEHRLDVVPGAAVQFVPAEVGRNHGHCDADGADRFMVVRVSVISVRSGR